MISIFGMHRSGTSALAGALHMMGADLGPKSAWIQPAADNPRGFFEYVPVVDLDRDVLAALGGSWSSPPPLPPGWVSDERLIDLRERAEQLSAHMPPTMVVKDPRLSLVQPLWEEITTVPASVLCLRHPTAVAESLLTRNEFPIDQSLFLWFRYTAAALLARPDALVVEYEALLTDPIPQLRRVTDHIALDVSDKTIGAAARAIYRIMAHHDGTDLPDSPIGLVCQRLYERLRSGEVLADDQMVSIWSRLVTELPWSGPADKDISRAQQEVADLKREIDHLTQDNQRWESRCQRLETELRYALRAIDFVSVTGAADLLRAEEADLR